MTQKYILEGRKNKLFGPQKLSWVRLLPQGIKGEVKFSSLHKQTHSLLFKHIHDRDITISRAAPIDLEYAMTQSYGTKARGMG